MPQLIEKDGNYYLRKSYDLALTDEGLKLLQDVQVNQFIDKKFFKTLCDQGYVALFPDGSSAKPRDSMQVEDSELVSEESCDSLGELLASIRKVEERFSLYGIEIEVRIKPSKSN
jgi:hypothetical protein